MRCWVLLATALLLVSPATASVIGATQIDGYGLHARVSSASSVSHPTSSDDLVAAGPGRIHVVDDVVTLPLTLVGSNALAYSDRHESNVTMASGDTWTMSSADSDAAAVLQGATATMDTGGQWSVVPSHDEVLERSHVYEEASHNAYYYAFYAPSGGNLSTSSATWSSASSHVYVWGIHLTNSNGAKVDTGLSIDRSRPGLEVRHYRFATLEVANITAKFSNPVATYAKALDLSPAGNFHAEYATGSIDDGAGRHEIDGPITGRGNLAVTQESGVLRVDVSGQVLDGGHLIPAHPTSVLVGVSVAAVAVVVAAAIALLFAARSGRLGDYDAWCNRAATWSMRHQSRRARWAATLAIKLDNSQPDPWQIRAEANSARGRHAQAAADWGESYALLVKPHSRAVSAFQASRAAARSGNAAACVHWLKLAYQCDPSFMDEASTDADFAHVAEHPVFHRELRKLFGSEWAYQT
jgi:hypothetical protein